jgi:hypothetical protein
MHGEEQGTDIGDWGFFFFFLDVRADGGFWKSSPVGGEEKRE